ncbi:MAG: hypothetical protein LW699_15770 [Pirellula sp.]|jgi:hypothetical protein|nr:hypothetical protein [Pirellula sp.]
MNDTAAALELIEAIKEHLGNVLAEQLFSVAKLEGQAMSEPQQEAQRQAARVSKAILASQSAALVAIRLEYRTTANQPQTIVIRPDGSLEI